MKSSEKKKKNVTHDLYSVFIGLMRGKLSCKPPKADKMFHICNALLFALTIIHGNEL